MGFEEITGRRVALRPLHERDVEVIEGWLDEASRAAGPSYPLGANRALVIERMSEEGAIGLFEYAVRDGWIRVSFIALAKAYRGWGYGSEAVRLLEEWALGEGRAEHFRAEVPVGNGLGLYFWLRLGYRPAKRDEFEWRGEGERDRMTMVRVLGDVGSRK
ncbi:MAG TPA: GNAT family N-acetyltransferase [Dehalococcoidia bacterium]|nr:GNAT family N-acetyltransferase [Dehalococcoidia bacterium]